MTIELWQHQTEAVEKLRRAALAGCKRIVLQAPPGAGKTEIAVEIVKAARSKHNAVSFTVPFLNLVDQTVQRFVDRGINALELGVMQADHEMTNEAAPLQVISVQTLKNRPFPFASMVFVDECHIRHEAIQKWMTAYPDLLFVGLSATPWAKGMAEQWERLEIVETIQGLIDKGVLSPFRTFCPLERPDLQGLRKNASGDYAEGALSERMQEQRLVADVVKTWLDRAENRPTLVFAVDRAHAAKIADEFKEVGVRTAYVDAFTKMEARKRYIEGLRTGETQVIVSIATMTTGVDIPWVSCISYVRPTKSPILFVQSLTRGLRSHAGKADCLIFDHSTTTHRLGQVTDIAFDHLLSGTKADDSVMRLAPAPQARECMSCHYIVAPKEPVCPNCGSQVRVRTAIRCEDGELVEITPEALERKSAQKENKVWTTSDKQIFLAELRGFAEAMGYKEGWVSHKYRAKFSVWPNRFRHQDLKPIWPPSPSTASWIRSQQIRYAHSNNR